ncbi:MAG TPA: NFACT family protein [Candidatus Dorea intestinavium]|nr:NFACT family protein [Candidatus Dorea intestinavium]
MALDGITVANIVAELKTQMIDSRISKIAQPEHDELMITLKTKEGNKRLLISASPSLPLIYLGDKNKKSPMVAPNFCMLLRKHIGTGRITNVSQPSLERVIFIDIEHFDELGDLKQKRLAIELMGKHSNIIFMDHESNIIDSIKHISSHVSSVREVLPGRKYFIPDQAHKLSPLKISETAFIEALKSKADTIVPALYKSFVGISPTVAEEICYIADLNTMATPKDLDSDCLLHLYRQFTLFMERVSEEDFYPVIYFDGDKPVDYSSIPLTHYEDYTKEPYDSISELLIAYYDKKALITRIRQKSADLRHVVATALERNHKKYQLQLRQLEDTKDRDKFKEYGELINIYGYELKENDKVLVAYNYYQDKEVKIPIDPTLTPSQNSQKYFAKYNKKKRTYEALLELVRETKEEIDYLSTLSNALENATGEEDLQEIKEEMIQTGYVRKRHEKKKVKIKSAPLHFLSSDGYSIFVGKNNLQNDEISFNLGSNKDWWFHVKDAPGSHVLVVTNGEEIPDATYLEAAKLAAHFSSRRESDKIEVDYTLRKNLKKPTGSKPGFVVYYTNYSMITDSDIKGIHQVH